MTDAEVFELAELSDRLKANSKVKGLSFEMIVDMRTAARLIGGLVESPDVSLVIDVAEKHGWNGVENSKFLHGFLDEELTAFAEIKSLLAWMEETKCTALRDVDGWVVCHSGRFDLALLGDASPTVLDALRAAKKEYPGGPTHVEAD